MKKVTIKNNNNEILQVALFDNDQVMNEWIELLSKTSALGKDAYTETIKAPMDEQGNPIGQDEIVNHEAEYTVTIEDITAQHAIDQRIEAVVSSGKYDKIICDKCADLIRGLNKEHVLNYSQITSMIQAFAQIDFCIEKGMPKTLKPLIVSIIPDEVTITSEMKSLLLEVLKEY
jgi:hypothetical protein